MIQHLITGHAARSRDRFHVFQIRHIEITDAPGADLAVVLQAVESGNGVFERIVSSPVQQVAIEPIGPQSRKRALTSLDSAPAGRVRRQNLRNQKKPVTPPCDGLPHDFFRPAGAIHLGAVDMCQAKVDPQTERGDSGGTAGRLNMPGPLPNDRSAHYTLHPPERQYGVQPSESERVRHRVLKARLARAVGDVVEIALRVPFVEVDGGRNEIVG